MCADYMTKMLLQSMQPINIFIYLTCLQVFQVNGQCVNQLGVVKNGQTCVQLNPRECYDATVLNKCCQSCSAISTGVKGCEYGDKVANCIGVLCPFYTDPNECCATCKFTTTATTPSPPVTTITKTATQLRTIATTIKTQTRQATFATTTRTSAPQPTIATTKTTTSQSTIAITIKRPTSRPATARTTKRATSQSPIAKATIKRATLLSTSTTIRETALKVSSATSSLQLALIRPFVGSLQPYMSSSLVIIGLHFAIKFTIDYELNHQ